MDGFIYNQPVSGRSFIARKEEAAELSELLRQGENVVMFEAPKTGVSSLLNYALSSLRAGGRTIVVAEQSLLRIRDVESAACHLGTAILRTAYNTVEEMKEAVEELLPGTGFRFDKGSYSQGGAALALDGALTEEDVSQLVTLPCRIPHNEQARMMILLEDFQNIMLCERGMWFCKMFEKQLGRPGSQDKKFFSWIFCGSAYNAMKEIFEVQKFFFFQVKRVKLQRPDGKELVDYANKTFLSAGKVIDKELMSGVCRKLKNNLWYVNHFCSICDGLSKGYIMGPVMDESLSALINIHEPRFKATIEDLTTYQLHLLRAIVDGHKHFSSADTIREYGFNSSANVRRLKDALCKKEIISFNRKDEPEFLDPLFEFWVNEYFFEIRK
ncbi:MAG: hypothetical protein MJY61_01370 [Bacteroidales bacterium]|nr:hypothetical protein [Bacteroidales bacterium]